jgi:5-methylcytosine-specific restriction protein A
MSRQFSRDTMRLAWNRCGGRCERCSTKLTSGNTNYDHEISYELSYDSSVWNCQVLCKTCHSYKTGAQDAPVIAEATRQSDLHHGITGPGLGRAPMAAGRKSRLKKTFRHGVVDRKTQVELYRTFMRDRFAGWRP